MNKIFVFALGIIMSQTSLAAELNLELNSEYRASYVEGVGQAKLIVINDREVRISTDSNICQENGACQLVWKSGDIYSAHFQLDKVYDRFGHVIYKAELIESPYYDSVMVQNISQMEITLEADLSEGYRMFGKDENIVPKSLILKVSQPDKSRQYNLKLQN